VPLTIEDDRTPSPTSTESEHPPLTAISDETTAMHRRHFGRGPDAVKSYLSDDLLVCILAGVLTPLEEALIEAGRDDQVLTARVIIQDAAAEECKERMAAIVGRQVIAYLASIDAYADTGADVYVLSAKGNKDGSTGTGTDSFH
jgi:uncharacterized protein YbcI